MTDQPRRLGSDAKPDLQAMVDAVLPFAQEMLAKRGSFHPFGASMDVQGTVTAVAADPGSELPTPESVIELLEAGYRKQAASGTLRCAAICESLTITRKTEGSTLAIKMSVEHSLGDSVAFYLPYSKRLLRGYQFGAMFATPRPPTFLGRPSIGDAT